MDAAFEFGQQVEGKLELAQDLEIIVHARATSSRAQNGQLRGGHQLGSLGPSRPIGGLVAVTLGELPLGLEFANGRNGALET